MHLYNYIYRCTTFFIYQLDGKLVGVLNLTLEEDREMQIADTATNSKIVNSKEVEYPQG